MKEPLVLSQATFTLTLKSDKNCKAQLLLQ